ncbi:hypothetical protein [Bradyrhizobium sp. 187]|uniref:hypothetical protein n=1 Tax=Bradyrhizobium sp. 187 TaxID=2782655 RepID=UPI001FFE97F1|nr:hypothetical protein [Bradyrhizobium sp. 187]UPJ76137.1 hypothetical protein IVB19_17225 [Bradyrhizobium sp. 187]
MRGVFGWAMRRVSDILFGSFLTLFIGWCFRRLGRFSYLLGENAVVGSIDDEIAKHLGLTAPAVISFLWDWCVPPALAIAAIWAYHLIKEPDLDYPNRRRKLLGLSLATLGGVLLLAGVGLLLNVGSRDEATATGDRKGSSSAPEIASTRTNSILKKNRYYSAKNKEELAARLDRISEAINKVDTEALKRAELALLPRFLARPAGEARDNIEKLDQVETAAQKMDFSLYGDMLQNERDYREEINELLFPRDPLNDFVAAAKAYRNSITVWMKVGSNIADDETSRSFREMVTASLGSFSKAKNGFVEWLSQRQELVNKARSELRS